VDTKLDKLSNKRDEKFLKDSNSAAFSEQDRPPYPGAHSQTGRQVGSPMKQLESCFFVEKWKKRQLPWFEHPSAHSWARWKQLPGSLLLREQKSESGQSKSDKHWLGDGKVVEKHCVFASPAIPM
jgi:hypothetical protein